MQLFDPNHVWQQRKVVVIVGRVKSQWLIVQSRSRLRMLNGRSGQQATTEPTPKPHEAKQPSDVQKQCNKHKQTQADQANTHATTKATTSRSRGEHKQKQRETQAETMGSTSRNKEKHKQKQQGTQGEDTSRNKEKPKQKQGETQAETRRNTRKNRGIHKQKQRNTLAEP